MPDASAEFFQAVIDEHRRRPRNRGPLPSAHRVAKRENPACGDFCTLQFVLDPAPPPAPPPDVGSAPALAPGTRVAAAAFTGAGCALSQASASLATVALAGRDLDEVRQLAATVETLVLVGRLTRPDPAPESFGDLGDLAALAAVHAFPARHACALLAWRAALDALAPRNLG